MGFSFQDPADSPTAGSPLLAPTGIPQKEGVSLNSDEVSSTHLPDIKGVMHKRSFMLVLGIKGVVNPISPSFDPLFSRKSMLPHMYNGSRPS